MWYSAPSSWSPRKASALSDTAQKFFDYVTSADASQIISDAGAVPVK